MFDEIKTEDSSEQNSRHRIQNKQEMIRGNCKKHRTAQDVFKIISIFTGALLLLLNQPSASAQISLPRIIRDSMILQRKMPVTMWGWSSAKERVSVSFKNKRYSTQANDNGEWKIELPAMQEGGPFTMEIRGKNTIKLKEILIGDVWLCSGQSNMEHQMRLHAVRYKEDIDPTFYRP